MQRHAVTAIDIEFRSLATTYKKVLYPHASHSIWLTIAAAVIWAVVNELLIQPMEYTCFNLTLKKLQDDPRVTVRLGTPVSGYGQESRNRQARQRIPHRVYKDANGTEKVQVPISQAWVSLSLYVLCCIHTCFQRQHLFLVLMFPAQSDCSRFNVNLNSS